MIQTRTSYEIAADDLVAVLYHNKAAYHDIRFKHQLLPKLMPDGNHQLFTEAVYWLYEHNKPIHDTTIIERAPSISPQWLAERVTLYDDTRLGQVIGENCNIVRDEGLHRGTQRLLQIAHSQLQEKGAAKRPEIIGRLVNLLSTIGTEAKAEAVLASEHGRLNRLKDANSVDGIRTQIPCIDDWTHGYERAHIWWIGGAYKGRKTTLLLNMFLAIAMYLLRNPDEDIDISPAFLSREMLQGRVQRQIESMLAIAYIYKKGLYGKTYNNTNGYEVHYNWIDHSLIKRLNRSYGHLEGEAQLHAYQSWLGDERGYAVYWAQRIYDKLTFRIYDSTPEHGNLSDYYSVDTAINMDMVNHGGNWFGIDYLQLIDAPGDNLFSKVNFMAQQLQQKAQRKNITIIVLAQLNEDTIKNGESYSPGVKGGGDPAQTADYFLRTRYNDDQATSDETQLSVQMKLSRHGAGGNGVREILEIHPASGLILNQDWIQELKV